MKNIVFDLGGVVFARDRNKCTPEFLAFFDFVRHDPMPQFWEEYDRGALTLDEVTERLCAYHQCDREICEEFIRLSIDKQETIVHTAELIAELKAAGYRLYVLSNMSREYIDFLRRQPVYELFDGEVVSCEEGVVKPEQEIYEVLLGRFGLQADETLFVDDRAANIHAADRLGIHTFLFDYTAPAASCAALRHQLL